MDPGAGATAWLIAVQAGTTLVMTGVIWMVQVVQYPGFARVGPDAFPAFHNHHCRRIGLLVGVLMPVELLSGIALAWLGEPAWFWRVMLAALLAIWASTAFLQGPLHGRLATEGPQPELIRRLVAGNWIRTVLWTVRSLGLLWFYARGCALS